MAKSKSSSKKTKKTPKEVATDKLVEAILDSPMQPTQDTIALARAIQTLRSYEMKTSRVAEEEQNAAVRRLKEKVLRLVLDEVLDSETLRVMDISTILSYIAADASLLPLWDNEHSKMIDDIIIDSGLFDEDDQDEERSQDGGPSKKERIMKTGDILMSLGKGCIAETDCDCHGD